MTSALNSKNRAVPAEIGRALLPRALSDQFSHELEPSSALVACSDELHGCWPRSMLLRPLLGHAEAENKLASSSSFSRCSRLGEPWPEAPICQLQQASHGGNGGGAAISSPSGAGPLSSPLLLILAVQG